MVAGGSHPSLHASGCLLLCACTTLCVTLAGALNSLIVCLCFVFVRGTCLVLAAGQTPNFLAGTAVLQILLSLDTGSNDRQTPAVIVIAN